MIRASECYAPRLMARFRARYCIRCGQALVRRDDNGSLRPTCPACGYVHYRNPAPAAGVILGRPGELLLVRRRYAPRAGAILYTAEPAGGRLRPGDDAIAARFFPLAALPRDLAFASHEKAIADFRARIRAR